MSSSSSVSFLCSSTCMHVSSSSPFSLSSFLFPPLPLSPPLSPSLLSFSPPLSLPFSSSFSLPQGLKARGNVENWLTNVEESMVVSLRKLTKAAIADFETRPRHEWATMHPSQVRESPPTLLHVQIALYST